MLAFLSLNILRSITIGPRSKRLISGIAHTSTLTLTEVIVPPTSAATTLTVEFEPVHFSFPLCLFQKSIMAVLCNFGPSPTVSTYESDTSLPDIRKEQRHSLQLNIDPQEDCTFYNSGSESIQLHGQLGESQVSYPDLSN